MRGQLHRHRCRYGAAALGNQRRRRPVIQASGTTIGGTVAGAGNVISANGGFGIDIFAVGTVTAAGNLVAGNIIGTDSSGTRPLGNTDSGVEITGLEQHDRRHFRGGRQCHRLQRPRRHLAAAGNPPGLNNAILGDLFFGNARGVGIDLNDDGPTQNYVGPIPAGGLPVPTTCRTPRSSPASRRRPVGLRPSR